MRGIRKLAERLKRMEQQELSVSPSAILSGLKVGDAVYVVPPTTDPWAVGASFMRPVRLRIVTAIGGYLIWHRPARWYDRLRWWLEANRKGLPIRRVLP